MIIYGYPYSTYETFSSGLPTKYWKLSENFQFYKSGIDDPSNDLYFVATGTDDYSHAYLEIDIDCLDGNISFYWAALDEQFSCSGNFYIDNERKGSINGSLEYFETYIEMGKHKLKWDWWQEPLSETSQTYLAIKNINIPDINNSIITPNNITDLCLNVVKIGVWADLNATEFMFNDTAARVNIDKNTIPTISLIAPYNLQERYLDVASTIAIDFIDGSIDPYAELDQPLGIRLEINSSTVDYFTEYNLTQYLQVHQGCSLFLLKDLGISLTDSLEFKLSFEYSGDKTLTLLVFDVSINSGPVPVIELLPDMPVTTFPATFECNILDNAYSISYCFNSIDAENYTNFTPYTTPIEIADNTLVYLAIYEYNKLVYDFSYNAQIYSGIIQVFPIVKQAPVIILQTISINGTNAVVLETYPIRIPIAICSFEQGCISFTTYDLNPIYALNNDTITACLYTHDIATNGFYDLYTDTPDLNSIAVFKISYNTEVASNKKVFEWAILKEVNSYAISIITNIKDTKLYSPFHIEARSNIDLTEFGYYIEIFINNELVPYGQLIDSTCSIVINITNGTNIITSLNSTVTFIDFYAYIKFCSLKRLGKDYSSTFIKVYTYIISRSYSLCSYKYLNSISNLETILKESDYESYKLYITSNDIYSLFLDSNLLYPIPFSFDIGLAGSKFFGIPDINTSVYKEGILYTDYTASNLLCQLTKESAYSTILHLVPSACLRLSIDVSNNKTSIVKQIWTNLPANSILYSNNSIITLSNDGLIFTRSIVISNATLYVKAIAPTSFSFGNNILNIVLDYISVEQIC